VVELGDSSPLAGGLFSARDDKDDRCCDLDLTTRLICGAVATGLGVLFAILAFVTLADSTVTFAILYTVSIAAAVIASFFFAGPKKHIAQLKECPAHLVSSIILILAMILIFIGAFAFDPEKQHSAQLAVVIIAFIVELVALFFFYLTLYPLPWKAFKAFVSKIFKCG
jgi:hypothetical protein